MRQPLAFESFPRVVMRLSSIGLSGLFLAACLGAAIAQGDGFGYLPYPGAGDSGLYAGLRGSMALRGKDGATSIPTTPTATTLRGSHDTGYGGSIVLGGHLPLGFKVELEGLYR